MTSGGRGPLYTRPMSIYDLDDLAAGDLVNLGNPGAAVCWAAVLDVTTCQDSPYREDADCDEECRGVVVYREDGQEPYEWHVPWGDTLLVRYAASDGPDVVAAENEAPENDAAAVTG
jgi:hypothetical protein